MTSQVIKLERRANALAPVDLTGKTEAELLGDVGRNH